MAPLRQAYSITRAAPGPLDESRTTRRFHTRPHTNTRIKGFS